MRKTQVRSKYLVLSWPNSPASTSNWVQTKHIFLPPPVMPEILHAWAFHCFPASHYISLWPISSGDLALSVQTHCMQLEAAFVFSLFSVHIILDSVFSCRCLYYVSSVHTRFVFLFGLLIICQHFLHLLFILPLFPQIIPKKWTALSLTSPLQSIAPFHITKITQTLPNFFPLCEKKALYELEVCGFKFLQSA